MTKKTYEEPTAEVVLMEDKNVFCATSTDVTFPDQDPDNPEGLGL